MCFDHDHSHVHYGADGGAADIAGGRTGLAPTGKAEAETRWTLVTPQTMDEQAEYLVGQPEMLEKYYKSFAPGFIGFGRTRPGDKVIIVIDSNVDLEIPNAVMRALRGRGAKVDLLVRDAGPTREMHELDELRLMMRSLPPATWTALSKVREWLESHRVDNRFGLSPWVIDAVRNQGYDLLVQGNAYASDYETAFRWEGHPWSQPEVFMSRANNFPRDLHELINRRAWEQVWERGRRARVHVTDPEGTDFTYTLLPDYWEKTGFAWFGETPCWNHLMYHPGPPIVGGEDASGVAAGCMAHYAKPYPHIQVEFDRGLVHKVEGGGIYGAAWRELLDVTQDIQYPDFPRPGLFWLWEIAAGTNPKVSRPALRNSGNNIEWERWRSGVIHLGFGSAGGHTDWAVVRGYPYGHLHVHIFFPTVVLELPSGEKQTLVSNGHLAALDDPQVRALAARYGDPDELLKEEWVPSIPGISAPGEYATYAQDPASWIVGEAAR